MDRNEAEGCAQQWIAIALQSGVIHLSAANGGEGRTDWDAEYLAGLYKSLVEKLQKK